MQLTDYLGDCRLVFLSVGRFFWSWNGELYLSIRIEPEPENISTRKLLKPGLCLEVGATLKVTDTLSLNLKPGILELNEFLRLVQTTKVRGTQELEWRMRANLLRKIGEDSDWLKVGVYQIITYEGFVPASSICPLQPVSLLILKSLLGHQTLLLEALRIQSGMRFDN